MTGYWIYPDGTSGTQNGINATSSGLYKFVASSGFCNGSATVLVTEDKVLPVITIDNPTQLSCGATQVQLSGSA